MFDLIHYLQNLVIVEDALAMPDMPDASGRRGPEYGAHNFSTQSIYSAPEWNIYDQLIKCWKMARLTINTTLGFLALLATLSAVAAQDPLQAVLTPSLTPWPRV